ncbi:MAG: HupE/UreJ family protein [Cyanobacteria bacterium J06648_16]
MTAPLYVSVGSSEVAQPGPRTARITARIKVSQRQVYCAIAIQTLIVVLAFASPAFAHHPFGGTTPGSWLEGFLSGLGHPIIGTDHLVFTVLIGLLAALLSPGWAVIGTFLAAALAGTGLHLLAIDLPAPEFTIALSVLLVGALVARGQQLPILAVLLLTAGAGLFHGYAYGEAIVGAEMTPLVAYLIGFTAVQGAIATVAYGLIRRMLDPTQRLARLRTVGLLACGAGAALLASVVLS